MNRLSLPAAVSLFFPLFAAANAIAQTEWEYLFKGNDHMEFYFDFEEEADPEEVFIFKADGGLLIKGKDQPNGYLQTLDEYENFELEFEWRWPDEPGEGGIQILGTSDVAYSIWPEGIKIQLQAENVGDFWLYNTKLEVEEEQMPNKAADRNRRLRLKVDEEKFYDKLEDRAETWNRMRILAKDDTVKVYINDERVNEGKAAARSAGYIAVLTEGANFELRNFRIRELDAD